MARQLQYHHGIPGYPVAPDLWLWLCAKPSDAKHVHGGGRWPTGLLFPLQQVTPPPMSYCRTMRCSYVPFIMHLRTKHRNALYMNKVLLSCYFSFFLRKDFSFGCSCFQRVIGNLLAVPKRPYSLNVEHRDSIFITKVFWRSFVLRKRWFNCTGLHLT